MDATTPETLLEHAAWVRRLARGLVADMHGAAELEQQIWLAALTHAPGSETGRARGWFRRVAENLTHRTLRTKARVAEREENAARGEAQPSSDELVERADLTRALVEHVVALDEPYRSTLLLRYFEELSPPEIARRDGTPVRTVNTRLARGLAQLRERLDRAGGREAWMPALIAWCDPPRSPLPLVPTVMLMKTTTKIACAVLLLVLVGGGTWLAMRDTSAQDAPTGGRTVLEPHSETPSATPSLTMSGAAPERTAVPAPVSTPAPAVKAPALRGRVVDRAGQSIAGAQVALSTVSGAVFNWSSGAVPEVFASTESAADGTFSIDVATARVGELSAAAKGFGKAYAGRRRAGDVVDIVLDRAGTLAGRVTREPDGAPVEGAKVVVRGTDNAVYNPVLAEAITGADGLYRVQDLAARDYWVWVSARGGSSKVETISVTSAGRVAHDFRLGAVREVVVRGRVTDATTSAPIAGASVGVDADACRTDPSGAFELHAIIGAKTNRFPVTAGARGYVDKNVGVAGDAGSNLEIALTPGRTVLGKVIDPAGAPVADARVALFDESQGQAPTGGIKLRTDAAGAFEFSGLQSDARYGLIVVADGLAAAAFELPALDSDRKDLGVIGLEPAAALVAMIVDEAGKPWVDCDVQLEGGAAKRARFTKEAVDAFTPRFGLRMNKTRADGRAVFGELAAGDYVFKARLAGRSAWVETAVTLAEGQVREDFQMVLPRGLSLRGRTVDPEGRPVAGVFVLVQRPGVDGVAGSTNVGSDGAFDIAGLQPGEYVVRTTIGLVSSAEARARFASGKWTLSPGGAPQDLVMPLVTTIKGRVVGADGQPIANASVSAWDAGAGMPDASTRTDAEGAFALNVRSGAAFELRANVKSGDTIVRGSVPNVAAGAENVELRLATQ